MPGWFKKGLLAIVFPISSAVREMTEAEKPKSPRIQFFNFPGERDKGNFGGLEDHVSAWM